MARVEAVEIVGDPDRVGRDRVRAAAGRRLGDDGGELGQALDQVALLVREPGRRVGRRRRLAGVAEDPGDAGVRVLDVVDRVLLALLGGQVDVDLDRLVAPARDEVPTGGVDPDLVEELIEEDDVPAASTSSPPAARGSGGRADR